MSSWLALAAVVAASLAIVVLGTYLRVSKYWPEEDEEH